MIFSVIGPPCSGKTTTIEKFLELSDPETGNRYKDKFTYLSIDTLRTKHNGLELEAWTEFINASLEYETEHLILESSGASKFYLQNIKFNRNIILVDLFFEIIFFAYKGVLLSRLNDRKTLPLKAYPHLNIQKSIDYIMSMILPLCKTKPDSFIINTSNETFNNTLLQFHSIYLTITNS